MKIALLGYGKMGMAIEKIALERGHTITLKTTLEQPQFECSEADVAIDFSAPSIAFDNVSKCIQHKLPVICGTTGWLDQYEQVVALCKEKKGAFLYASNFSLGVNIFFELNDFLAKLMHPHNDYNVSIKETHHTQKIDKPSGTAITLAEGIIKNSIKKDWQLDAEKDNQTIPIKAKRKEKVPGTHSVKYDSLIDTLTIKHKAHSREGFALGAIVAAEWIHNKIGVFTMRDVLNF